MTIIAYRRSRGSSDSLDCSHPEVLDEASFRTQLNQLAILSAEAQDLKKPITSYEKLFSCDVIDQVVLVYVDIAHGKITGYLKYGSKAFLYFYKPPKGQLVQLDSTLCLLDFYVLETQQRSGIGKKLFDEFLQLTRVSPGQVAFDRPSPKLLPFLAKHYHLHHPDLQPNRYTIFPQLFFTA